MERERFSFGGMKAFKAGLNITDKCITCGKCARICTFNAIKPGKPYDNTDRRNF